MTDRYQEPRYGGVPTFMRLPWSPEEDTLPDVEGAFLGVPWDSDGGYRAGARFGPRALRLASSFLNPYNPVHDVDLRAHRLTDVGDVFTIPGEVTETYDSIRTRVSSLLDADVIPVVGGGTHGITLPILRAIENKHGSVSLLHFDAHADLWNESSRYRQYPAGWCGYAIDEGLIDPATSVRIGDRGNFPSPDAAVRAESGLRWIGTHELMNQSTADVAAEIRERIEGKVYVTIDLDVFDPAFVPAVSTPSPAGAFPSDILDLIQDLTNLDIIGMDVVELCPPYESTGCRSALTAARLLCELLGLALS